MYTYNGDKEPLHYILNRSAEDNTVPVHFSGWLLGNINEDIVLYLSEQGTFIITHTDAKENTLNVYTYEHPSQLIPEIEFELNSSSFVVRKLLKDFVIEKI